MTPPRGTSGKSRNYEQRWGCLFGGDLTPRTQQHERCLTKDRFLLWLWIKSRWFIYTQLADPEPSVECMKLSCLTATVSVSRDPEYLKVCIVTTCFFLPFFCQITLTYQDISLQSLQSADECLFCLAMNTKKQFFILLYFVTSHLEFLFF